MDVHLRHLRYFVAVAEELHFRKAAERLFVSQPALSRQIAKLEADLRTQLLVRDRRSVSLTPAGAALLDHARTLMSGWDEAQRVVSDTAAAANAVVRVGMHTSVGRGIVAGLQARLQTRNPNWRLEPVLIPWDDPTVGLADGRVDLAVRWLPVPAPESVTVTIVATEQRHVAMAAVHPMAGRAEVRFADIADEPLIALPETAGELRDFWLAEDERSTPAKVAMVAHAADETFEAIASGIGMVILSEGNARLYQRANIVSIPITDIAPARLAVVSRADDSRSIIRDLIETSAIGR